ILLSSMAYIGIAFAETEQETIDIDIKIAPATLNLEFKGPWITIHTDIPYNEVNSDTIELNGIPVFSTFADDRGNLVAKFKSADVKAIVVPSEATLTLTGETDVGGSFEGSDTIRVIDPPSK
ncbi:MAG: hypothetical protein GQ533_04030, partial [Methanosarcinaceae archaeon]|nr:hypothetical protein [Methanosarcinaceae archaeon]